MKSRNPMLGDNIPHGGWLRALRTEKGLTLRAVAERLRMTPQAVHQFEKSEVAGTISLRQLALVAAAMGGRLSYEIQAEAGAPGLANGPGNKSADERPQSPEPSEPPASLKQDDASREPTVSEAPVRAVALFRDYLENGAD